MNYGEELQSLGGKRHAPAALRNAEVIAETLASELPEKGLVLEIASGTGEHAVHFAGAFPSLDWQPSDCDDAALQSIAAYWAESELPNLREPIAINAMQDDWPVAACDAVICVNMVHISPWRATIGLFEGAARLLDRSQPLILYGPYRERGVETAPSNERFDHSLRERNAEWGLRDVSDIDTVADARGLARTARYAMPANNLTLVYRRT